MRVAFGQARQNDKVVLRFRHQRLHPVFRLEGWDGGHAVEIALLQHGRLEILLEPVLGRASQPCVVGHALELMAAVVADVGRVRVDGMRTGVVRLTKFRLHLRDEDFRGEENVDGLDEIAPKTALSEIHAHRGRVGVAERDLRSEIPCGA